LEVSKYRQENANRRETKENESIDCFIFGFFVKIGTLAATEVIKQDAHSVYKYQTPRQLFPEGKEWGGND
jgi:hypothetical protein